MNKQACSSPRTYAIDRIARISCDDFRNTYLRTRTPVVITSMLDDMPALRLWTEDYLVSTLGDVPRRIEYYADDGVLSRPCEDQIRHLTFAEYLRVEEKRGARSGRHYLVDTLENIPELVADFRLPALIDWRRYQSSLFWAGYDTNFPGHYHVSSESFLCMIRGAKRVIMYPPEQLHELALYPWYDRRYVQFSRANFEPNGFPELPSTTTPFECVVNAGELLFIPLEWTHFVVGTGFTINLTPCFEPRSLSVAFPRLRALALRSRLRVRQLAGK